MPILRLTMPQNLVEMTHVLVGERITIGRRPDNTIQILDGSVSGYHAELIAVNGHYRLHDLSSTNLTSIDGQPINDFHLYQSCKVCFGNIECDYRIENPLLAGENSKELVHTRSEIEFWTRENHDLQAKIAIQQKQIDILSSARLMTKEATKLSVAPEAHRQMALQRDQLRAENESLKDEIEGLGVDLSAVMRERDAMRQAWETLKAELAIARAENASLSGVDVSRTQRIPLPHLARRPS